MAKSRNKLNLIQEMTTYKNDYKPWRLPKQEPPLSGKVEEYGNRKPTKIPQIDYQSHIQYTSDVPFDLHIQPKPIIGTNPREPINFTKSKNHKFKTDNFVCRLPGKQLTKVTDEEVIRNLLIGTYQTAHAAIYEYACLKIPNPPDRAETVLVNDKVSFRPALYPPLPPGWLEAVKHWDCLQSRILGDPTKTFWSRRGPEVELFSKSNYNDIIPVETRKEIRNLIEEDRLRLPFSITKTGYGGYRQISGKGVPLRRNENFDF